MLDSHLPPFPLATDRTSSKILFSWLLLLRWGASLCQAILIGTVALFFKIEIPILILLCIIGFQLLSNIYFTRLKKLKLDIPDWLFNSVMFLDATLLTLLLHYTGGPMNPFTFIYLLHVVVGAVLMRPAWTWWLAIFTIACYGALFFLSDQPSPDINGLAPAGMGDNQTVCLSMLENSSMVAEHLKLHLWGMWLAFSLTTVAIVFFMQRIQEALKVHQATLADLAAAKIRNEKLASLATLAAGAAHEFSTPLSTIAVAAGEMLHFLKKSGGPTDLIEDTRLIRAQVERCKEILFQMAADAGEHLGEAVQDFTIGELIAGALRTFNSEQQQQINASNRAGDLTLTMPLRTLTRIIRGLLKNSLDASDKRPVRFDCWADARYLYLQVSDEGLGMDAETLQRATEPFFTRKDPGKGLGLGLFLARSAAERFGGRLELSSAAGHGTQVTLTLELAQILKKQP